MRRRRRQAERIDGLHDQHKLRVGRVDRGREIDLRLHFFQGLVQPVVDASNARACVPVCDALTPARSRSWDRPRRAHLSEQNRAIA